MRSEFYEQYIKSHEWQIKRLAALERSGCRCERCGARDGERVLAQGKIKHLSLHCHHLTYDRLGNEELDDLEILCEWCHEVADEWRKRGDHRSCRQKMIEFCKRIWGERWDAFETEGREHWWASNSW